MPSLDDLVSLCKRRGFVFPGSELYGGLANSWDYGPYGVELKNNIKNLWWNRFVHRRDDIVGIDAALIMNPKVWESSRHLANFSDPLVECKKCHSRFRADEISGILDVPTCPNCGAKENNWTVPQQFNLMLKTFLGPAEEKANEVFFRPETAQAMFVDFKQVQDTAHKKLPFGIAQIGKAFRNEITPGNFIFRTREFEQMEIEYFIREVDWEKSFEHWRLEMRDWMENDLGLDMNHVHELDVPDGERAHYSKKTIDFEYDFPFGKKELYGLAYRTDFDLKNHFKEPPYREEGEEAFYPHVIEPTWGVDRSVLAVLSNAYTEETLENGESRIVLKFNPRLAPVKVAVFPLLKNKPQLIEKARNVYHLLRERFVTEWDDHGNIGKRYRRQDEIGTPYCVTIDFDTVGQGESSSLKDTVTLRDRDTMKQERVNIDELTTLLESKLK